MNHLGPYFPGETTKVGRTQHQDDCARKQRQARHGGAHAAYLLQVNAQHEETQGDRGIDGQSGEITPGKIADTEESQRQHGLSSPGLVDEEQHHRNHTHHQRDPHLGAPPPHPPLFDEGIHWPAQANHGQESSQVIDAFALVPRRIRRPEPGKHWPDGHSGMTLMKKMTRHESKSTATPPISGPTMAAALVQPDHCPMAFDCAGPENDEMIMASELGTRRAPAIP